MPHVPQPPAGGPPPPPPPPPRRRAESPAGAPPRRRLGLTTIDLKNWTYDPARVYKILFGREATTDERTGGLVPRERQ